MGKPKILIELYGGLVTRIISSLDADIYVLTDDSKANTLEDLETWSPVILVRNDEELQQIISKKI